MSTSTASGMCSGEHTTSTAWVTILTVPPRLTRCLIGIDDVHWNTHSDLRALAQPQKVDVHRQVLHRIELKVARDDTLRGAVDLEVVDGCEKTAGIDALLQIGVIHGYVERRFAVAIDHARHAAGATLGAGGPLAGPRTRHRLDLLDVRHGANPLATKGRRDAAAHSAPSSLLGFWVAIMRGRSTTPAVRRAYSERARERQEMRDGRVAQKTTTIQSLIRCRMGSLKK